MALLLAAFRSPALALGVMGLNLLARITSVIGSEIVSAFCRSLLRMASKVSAKPACRTWAPGTARCARAATASRAALRSPASSGSPRRVAETRTARPPWACSTTALRATAGDASRRRCSVAAARAAPRASGARTRNVSAAGLRRCAASSRCSARRVSPVVLPVSVSFFVPIIEPAPRHPATIASHSRIMVLGRRVAMPAAARTARLSAPQAYAPEAYAPEDGGCWGAEGMPRQCTRPPRATLRRATESPRACRRPPPSG